MWEWTIPVFNAFAIVANANGHPVNYSRRQRSFYRHIYTIRIYREVLNVGDGARVVDWGVDLKNWMVYVELAKNVHVGWDSYRHPAVNIIVDELWNAFEILPDHYHPYDNVLHAKFGKQVRERVIADCGNLDNARDAQNSEQVARIMFDELVGLRRIIGPHLITHLEMDGWA